MRRQGKRLFRNYKRRGEWVELLFMTVAAGIGMNALRPWGDSTAYDVAVEIDGRFLRMQVKSTDFWTNGSYLCQIHACGNKVYSIKDIDYFALYVLPDDVWYIVPAKILEGMTAVALSPHRKGSKYDRYKESWWYLTRHHFRRGKRTVLPGQDQRPSSMNRLTGRMMDRVRVVGRDQSQLPPEEAGNGAGPKNSGR
jgi:PD-(D/E)XK endonuclease